MVIEVVTLFIESIAAATAILSESKKRRGADLEHSVVHALQALDVSTVLASMTEVELAVMMRGAMTASLANEVLADSQIRRLVSEAILAVVVEDQHEASVTIGSLIGLRVRSLLVGRVAADDADHFADELLNSIVESCGHLLRAALVIAPDAMISLQQLVAAKRTHSILQRVSDQLEAVIRAQSPDLTGDRVQFVDDYRRICAEVHGMIRPPDFETNQLVPLEDLYVAPTIRRFSEMDEQVELEDFVSSTDRTVVLGDPGGGKSTLSNYMTMVSARNVSGPLPFHVILREFAPVADSRSILQFIESQMPSKYQIEPPEGAIADILVGGDVVVVFDGLDELIDPTKRRAITSAVETFGMRYPMARIVVTSRRVGYEQARLDPAIYSSFKVDGFSRADIGEYVKKWFASQNDYTEIEAERLATEFIAQSQAVSDLSSNPLMLSLMCIIFRGENFIPRNRPAIYEKCAMLLFEKWDGHRQIEVPLQARDYVDAAMKHVAFIYLTSGAADSGILRTELIREMTSYLFPRAMETREAAERAAEEFIDFCAGRAWVFSDAGTTAAGEPIFTFTHRTFMEYFAAVHLIRISDTPENLAKVLLPHIAREEWDVVAQLAVQQSDKGHDRGTERALRTMLSDPRKRSRINRGRILNFLTRCCEFAVVSPALLREISVECLEFFLTSSEPQGDHDAVRPWIMLQQFVPEDQVAPVVNAQRERLLELLTDSRGPHWQNLIYICFLGLIRRFNGRVWNRSVRSAEWDHMITEVVSARLSVLRETLDANPALWGTLILGSVVSPAYGLERMRAAGRSFVDVYFSEGWTSNQDSSGTPFAGSIHAAIGNASAEVPLLDVEIVSVAAESFLQDFWASNEPRRFRRLRGSIFISAVHPPTAEMIRIVPLSQTLVDFQLLSSIGLLELAQSDGSPVQHLDGGRAAHLVDPATIGELGLSTDALSFVLAWLGGEASFFDSIEWLDSRGEALGSL